MTGSQRRPKQEKLKQKETITMKTKLTKTIMSSLAFTCALGCLVAAMALGTPDAARARTEFPQPCSVHTLHGLYLWSVNGYTSIDGNLLPIAVMVGKRFNGDGTLTNDFGTVNIGGTIIIDGTGEVGTYTVAPDCTGTISIPDGPSFNIYVEPGAQKLWHIENDGFGGVGVGTATRLPGR
jgi:hypothetical protein